MGPSAAEPESRHETRGDKSQTQITCVVSVSQINLSEMQSTRDTETYNYSIYSSPSTCAAFRNQTSTCSFCAAQLDNEPELLGCCGPELHTSRRTLLLQVDYWKPVTAGELGHCCILGDVVWCEMWLQGTGGCPAQCISESIRAEDALSSHYCHRHTQTESLPPTV